MMAEQTVTPIETWKKVARVGPRKVGSSPCITLRRSGDIGFGADFIRTAKIGECTRVSFFLSPDALHIAMRFHSNEEDQDSFLLCGDGGGKERIKRYVGRTVQITALKSQSQIISSLVRESLAARRFEPRRAAEGFWVIDLAPCFEKVFDGSRQSISGMTGIYRYRLGEDTVYIGRGALSERFSCQEKCGWQFERVEYSVINDDGLERKWESFWLNEYRERTHRWPVYNRIGGIHKAAEVAEAHSG